MSKSFLGLRALVAACFAASAFSAVVTSSAQASDNWRFGANALVGGGAAQSTYTYAGTSFTSSSEADLVAGVDLSAAYKVINGPSFEVGVGPELLFHSFIKGKRGASVSSNHGSLGVLTYAKYKLGSLQPYAGVGAGVGGFVSQSFTYQGTSATIQSKSDPGFFVRPVLGLDWGYFNVHLGVLVGKSGDKTTRHTAVSADLGLGVNF